MTPQVRTITSNLMMKACCTGKHLPKASITV
jgi:hypothetical protein